MDCQLELSFVRITRDAKPEELAEWLRGKGWLSAKEIKRITGLNDRAVRDLASRSGGLIVSWPGSPGYAHIQDAGGEDVQHGLAAFDNQIREMTRRRMDIARCFHRYGKASA